MDLSAITYSVFIPMLNYIHVFLYKFGLYSFGWSIVLLTAAVKIVLTPLTYKQIKSTKKMQIVQPKLKKLQDDFKKKEASLKSNPEALKKAQMEFQQSMMSFYKENNVNPLGGCLPLILQMPILIGLFWTFSGPPFKEKPIMVDVKVVAAAEAHRKEIKAASKGEIFVDIDGKRARVAANTKGLTLVEGEEFTLKTFKTMGEASPEPSKIKWNFFGDKESNPHVQIQDFHNGTALVRAVSPGSAKVQALLPAMSRNDQFFFIRVGNQGVFNKKTGAINFDIIILVLLFGISIWMSSALNTPKLPPAKPGEAEDPQVAMQRSMTTMMPIMMTVMMLFIPLPAGAFIYMVVSSFIQSGQTYFAMQRYNKKFAEL